MRAWPDGREEGTWALQALENLGLNPVLQHPSSVALGKSLQLCACRCPLLIDRIPTAQVGWDQSPNTGSSLEPVLHKVWFHYLPDQATGVGGEVTWGPQPGSVPDGKNPGLGECSSADPS